MARIGPNAVIRVAEALDAIEGRPVAERLFAAAGLAPYLAAPPRAMVEEAEVRALHAELYRSLGQRRARSVAWIAGQRTADYLLAHRIPRAVQRLLLLMPRPLAARLLARAIARHAWTFTGSGRLIVEAGNPMQFRIAACPLCRGLHAAEPACDYYVATFERLFAVLIHPDSRAVETECMAQGGAECRIGVGWP
jgi:divinyl protochlorophyllide a 8-vinyl-reductase